jgi:hypothetical protein
LTLQAQATTSLARVDARMFVPAFKALRLKPEEEQFIRDFFGLTGASTVSTRYWIGETNTEAAAPIPDDLVVKLPLLKGLNFAKDPQNGAILITDGANRIVAIVPSA